MNILDFIHQLHSADGIRQIIQTGGLLALVGIVFAETGLLAGFFLPGDSLLVTAGIFAAGDGAGGPGLFNLYVLLGAISVAAVVGDQVGYLLGKKTGHIMMKREDSMFFKKKHLVAAHGFYERHGARALIMARFAPIFRTFVPFAAGMADMSYASFVRYNIVGGILWAFSMILLGYFLGQTPLANELHKVILVVIVISVLPIFVTAFRAWRRKA